MAQYFFKMTQAEKNNILDQHKTIYDGYVTQYAQESNTQPLYVQDFANDKLGITVNNKGEVMPYTNMNINESIGLDMIGDGPTDLKGGTVALDGQNDNYKDRSMYDPYYDDEDEYISLGKDVDDDSEFVDSMEDLYDFDSEEMAENVYEYDIDETEDYTSQPMNEVDFEGEIDDEVLPEFMDKLHESLDMFRRLKNYN